MCPLQDGGCPGAPVDHVNGDGHIDKRAYGGLSSAAYYKDVANQAQSGKYQLLCANCHAIKTYEQGEWNTSKNRASKQALESKES